MAITLKQLDAVQKTLEAVIGDDAEAADQISKSFDGMREAIKKGGVITAEDLSEIMGEVMVEKIDSNPDTSGGATNDDPVDPLAPVFKQLHDELFDNGKIRKGVTSIQAVFQKAYEAAVDHLDGAIAAAIEATAIELGAGDRVQFGKAKQQEDKTGKRGKGYAEDDDGDEDCEEDMEKLLKSLGAPAAVVKKIGTLQSQVESLQAARDLDRFEKMAEDIGEADGFGVTLLKLHQIDPAVAQEVGKLLKGKNALLKKSNAWSREIGAEGGAGSAVDQLNSHAKEMVQKGEKDAKGRPLTFQKAFTEACSRFPELYTEYKKERRQ